MNLSICKRICNECPFTHSSPKGWLGPHSLEDVLQTQEQGKLFSCHMLRKEEMIKQDIESGDVKICRGFIASATKSGIDFSETGTGETESALRDLQVMVAEEAMENESDILSSQEFENHHGGASPKRLLSEDALNQRLGYKL